MKQKMKRWLSISLAVVLVLSMTACGSSLPKETEVEKPKPEAIQSPQTEVEPITVEFWSTHGESFGGAAIEAIIKEFNETNDKKITVNHVVYTEYTEMNAALQTALMTNKVPAVSTVAYSYLNYMAQNFNYVTPTDIIAKYFPEDANYLAEKYDPAVLDLGVAVDGKQFGCPYGLSIPLVYYNLDILKAAGLDTENLPTTWQEIREYAKTITEKTDYEGLYVQLPPDTYSVIPIFYAADVDSMYVDNGNGTYKTNFNTDEVVNVWSFMQDMYKEGSSVYLTINEGLVSFTSGQMGMCLTTSARLKSFIDSGVNLATNYHPKWENRDLAVCLGGNMLTLWGQTEAEQKAGWEFIKFCLEAENVAKFDDATGYVPPTSDVTTDMVSMLKNPLLGDLLDERSFARPWTSWPGANGMQVDQNLTKMRDQIILDFMDVKTAVQSAADAIDQLLK